jgi:hypothetical protein
MKMSQKIMLTLFLLISIVSSPAHSLSAGGPALRILFDDLHGQTYGNADWVPQEAYSNMADDYVRYLDAVIEVGSICSGSGQLDAAVLKNIDILVIPEPNIRFNPDEVPAIRAFVERGGGLLAIADHGDSDRNFDGWDSVLIFNELMAGWGITFAGTTWSETPLRGYMNSSHPIMTAVHRIGAWAATSIYVGSGTAHFEALLSPACASGTYIAAGAPGKGRVVAIGDSSPFDDGSGAVEKNRHNSYNSWQFDNPRLAVQSAAWLARRPNPSVPDIPLPFPSLDSIDPAKSAPEKYCVMIDAAHGNNDADNLDRFGSQIAHDLPSDVLISVLPLDARLPDGMLVLTNPSAGLSDPEAMLLGEWVRRGNRLIIAANNARNPLNAIGSLNGLLIRLGSKIRIRADEVQDERNNTGKPWSVLVKTFADQAEFSGVDRAVFWGVSSLIGETGALLTCGNGVNVLAWTGPEAKASIPGSASSGNMQPLPKNTSIPVAAIETIGRGKIVVLGADTFTNFQYIGENDKTGMDRSKWDHETPQFNLAIVKILKR